MCLLRTLGQVKTDVLDSKKTCPRKNNKETNKAEEWFLWGKEEHLVFEWRLCHFSEIGGFNIEHVLFSFRSLCLVTEWLIWWGEALLWWKRRTGRKTCALIFIWISGCVFHIKNRGGLILTHTACSLAHLSGLRRSAAEPWHCFVFFWNEIPVSIFFYAECYFSQDLKCLPVIIYNISHVPWTEICLNVNFAGARASFLPSLFEWETFLNTRFRCIYSWGEVIRTCREWWTFVYPT